MRAPVPVALCLGLATFFLTAGCASSGSTDAVATSAAPTTAKAPSPSGSSVSSASVAPASTDCPTKTQLTVHATTGDKKLEAKAAKATVTLGSTMNLSIGNYDVKDDSVGGIAAPKLTGDEMLATAYLSAAQGKTVLEPGTYVSVSDELGPLQFNTSAAYTADGKVLFSGISTVKETVTITKIDKGAKKVCGTITTQVFDGAFTADILSWS